MSFEQAKIPNSKICLSIQSSTTKETDIDTQDLKEIFEFTVKSLNFTSNIRTAHFTNENSQQFHQTENQDHKKPQLPLKSILKKSKFQLDNKISETNQGTKKKSGRMTLKQLEQSGIKCQQLQSEQQFSTNLEAKNNNNKQNQQQYFSMEQIDFETQFELIISRQIKIISNTSEENQIAKDN